MSIVTHSVHVLPVGTKFWWLVFRLTEEAYREHPEFNDWTTLDHCVFTKRDAIALSRLDWARLDWIEAPVGLQHNEVCSHSQTGTFCITLAETNLEGGEATWRNTC